MSCSYVVSGCGFMVELFRIDLRGFFFINLRCVNSVDVIFSSGVCARPGEARKGCT